jgi:hypothetical protein
MLVIIPALDFMRSLSGIYKAEAGSAELRVWACGYGVAVDLRGDRKTELVGVVGVYNSTVECYAQVGLPNVIRFVGHKTSESSIHFTSEDLPLEWHISRGAQSLRVTVSLQGQEKVAHVLHAA